MGYASGNYQTLSPHTGWAEQNPEDWWNRTYEALNTALSIARSNARTGVHVAGIGLTGQMHSLVLLDGTGTPVRPAIVWLDSRARTLVPEIHNTLETNNLLNCVKNRVAPGLTLCPLVWLQRNEPQALACAETLLLPKDYIRFRLTNTLGTDVTDASGTLLYDIPARSWSADILSAFNLPPSILPDIAAPSEPAATVAAELANSLGLDNQPIVATGAADQQASTLATGVLKPGLVQMMLGTGVQIASPTASGELELNGSLNYFCHHEGWLVQGSVQNGGSALNWVRSVLHADWDEVEKTAALHEPQGPFFLPYLTGERTPIMDEHATGAWLHLRHDTSRETTLYACNEGVAFSVADAVESLFTGLQLPPGTEIRCSGGGTRMPNYLQLLCDTLGQPLTVLPSSDSTALGAAILAGVASRTYAGLQPAVQALGLTAGESRHPNPERHSALARRREHRNRLRDEYLSWPLE